MTVISNENAQRDGVLQKTKGVVAAPLTGFNSDGSVNLAIVPPYAEMLKAGGVAGVFVNGTTGEAMSLTQQERVDLAESWVATASEDFKVIIHLGYAGHEMSCALAKHAVAIGAYAVGQIGPCTDQPKTVVDLVSRLAPTAEVASEIPYYYYHMPSISKVAFPMLDFLIEAAGRIPNLAGIKYTHEDLDDYQRCVLFDSGRFDILYGRDESLVHGLRCGAQGAVGSTYNFLTPLYIEIIKSFNEGNELEAEKLQGVSIQAVDLIAATGGFISGLKTVLGCMGLDLGPVRDPQVNLEQDVKEELLNNLRAIGVFEYLNIQEMA